MQNNILNLPDMEAIRKDFFSINEKGDTLMTIVMDGLSYTLEFMQKDRYRRIEYHCPVTYGKKYTNIPELRYITNIIRLIYEKIGNNYEPC